MVCYGYDNISATSQFTKYCTKWSKRKPADQRWTDFGSFITEFDEERREIITVEEASYTMNQVQKLIQTDISNEMAASCQPIADGNANPNIHPPLIPPAATTNALADVNLAKLANLL